MTQGRFFTNVFAFPSAEKMRGQRRARVSQEESSLLNKFALASSVLPGILQDG
jgi:hypothetical protein